jgi:hypothetical protein
MDHMYAVVAKSALWQSAVNLASVADQVEGSDPLFGLESPFDALDDHSTSVVATHDIHCNSHISTKRGETWAAPGQGQAPAVTVRTWRPL